MFRNLCAPFPFQKREKEILQELKNLHSDDKEIDDELKKELESAIIIKRCKFTFGTTSTGTNPLDVLMYKKQSGDFLESSENCHLVSEAFLLV